MIKVTALRLIELLLLLHEPAELVKVDLILLRAFEAVVEDEADVPLIKLNAKLVLEEFDELSDPDEAVSVLVEHFKCVF